jgi:outer membrane protein assembly factor BamB
MRRIGGLACALVIAVVAASCSSTGSHATSGATASTAPPLTVQPTSGVAGIPSEVSANADDWPLPGRDYSNSRATNASAITSANVAQLKPRWTATPSGIGALSTAPIVTKDTIYLQGGTGEIVAIDRATGHTRWTRATGFNIGPFGAAIANGRVFGDDGSSGVIALDAKTGAVDWRTRITTTKTLGVDIQPTVFAGLVLASSVPVSAGGIYAGGDVGRLVALDAATGKIRWHFDTVKGGTALWGNPGVNSGGGAWYPPAIDVRRRAVYFGTANPAPFPGTSAYPNGTSRPGPNLYTDSLVALNVDTGKLLWYHQVTAHDLFDRDQVHAMLASMGNGDQVVISAGKSGVVVALDPATGRVVWQRAIGQHHNDDLTTLPGPTEIAPGTYGGVETPPAATIGVAYFATVNEPVTLEPNKTAYFGAQMGKHDGEVVALDVATGTVEWDTKVPGDPLGGVAVVNDLVFTSLLDGTVVAINIDTSKIVWKYKTKGGINGFLSIAGNTVYVPVGQASPPELLALSL